MRKQKVLKETTDSRTYRLTQRRGDLACPVCPPHKGCNRHTVRRPYRNWKSHRKNQYHEK